MCSNAEYMKNWRLTDPEKWVVGSCKQTAKNKDLPFNITSDDVIIPTHYPALGIELKMGTSGLLASRDAAPSIDRIVPSKGYVRGNIVVVSFRANRIKTNATADEILAVGKFYKELKNEQ
jgi:hypothetical protein